jgi:hypothetical protein
VAAGRIVPHERVREWLGQLANGEKASPLDKTLTRRKS